MESEKQQEDIKIGDKVVAIYDFKARYDDELNLEEDDIIDLLEISEDGSWGLGDHNGQRGWFPMTYVKGVRNVETFQKMFEALDRLGPTPIISDSKIASFESDDENYSSPTHISHNSKTSEPSSRISKIDTENAINLEKSQGSGLPTPSLGNNVSVQNTVKVNTTGSISLVNLAVTKKLWKDEVDGKVDISKLSKSEISRQEVIFELLQTEKDYVEDLITIRELYIKEIKSNQLISQKDISVIFSNLEQIIPVNTEFLKELIQRQRKNLVVDSIGDILLKMSDYFKMYTMYCSNHPQSIVRLKSITSKQFLKFLEHQTTLPKSKNLELAHFLIKPVQRICKYPLLIREIIKYTDENHPDRKQLDLAFTKIGTVVTIVNEAARQTENVHRMLELQSKLSNKTPIVAPSRSLIKETQWDYLKKGSISKRKIYIFNDMFLMVKEGLIKDRLTVKATIPFEEISIDNHEGDTSKTFDICGANGEKLTFVGETKNSKDLTVKMILDLVKQYRERANSRLKSPMDMKGFSFQATEPREKPAITERSSSYTGNQNQKMDKESVDYDGTAKPKIQEPEKMQRKGKGSESSLARASKSGSLEKLSQGFGKTPSTSELMPKLSSKMDEKPVKPTNISNSDRAGSLEKLNQAGADSNVPKDLGQEGYKLRHSRSKDSLVNAKSDSSGLSKSRSRDRLDQIAMKSNLTKSASAEAINDISNKKGISRASSMTKRQSGNIRRSASSKDKLSEINRSNSTSSIGNMSDSIPIPNAISDSNDRIYQKGGLSKSGSRKSSRRPSANFETVAKDERKRSGSFRAPSHEVAEKAFDVVSETYKAKREAVLTGALLNTPIKSVSIIDVFRLPGSKKDYIYVVQVERQTEEYVIFLTFEDFFDFHLQMIGHFPNESGLNSSSRIIPDIPGQVMYVSETLALERKRQLSLYMKQMIELPSKLSRSYVIGNFLKKDGNRVIEMIKAPKLAKTASLASIRSSN